MRGLTLIELLIVIAIIAALAAISVPTASLLRANSHKASCMGNLRQIALGLENYLQDHQETMPTLATARLDRSDSTPVLETVLLEYINNPDSFHCPADRNEFARSGSSYLWNTLQNGRLRSQLQFLGVRAEPQLVPLVTDKESWHGEKDGVMILYGDFTVSNRLRFIAPAPAPPAP
jgi:prepilin-type N-terminal cleavage/methylation domain-containing protein